MPRGDKSKYTDKQKRQAGHIEEGYKEKGVSQDEAEARAWATVNKMTGGGKKPGGSGRGRAMDTGPAKNGGRIGGSNQSTEKRSLAAQKGWATRRMRQGQ